MTIHLPAAGVQREIHLDLVTGHLVRLADRRAAAVHELVLMEPGRLVQRVIAVDKRATDFVVEIIGACGEIASRHEDHEVGPVIVLPDELRQRLLAKGFELDIAYRWHATTVQPKTRRRPSAETPIRI